MSACSHACTLVPIFVIYITSEPVTVPLLLVAGKTNHLHSLLR